MKIRNYGNTINQFIAENGSYWLHIHRVTYTWRYHLIILVCRLVMPHCNCRPIHGKYSSPHSLIIWVCKHNLRCCSATEQTYHLYTKALLSAKALLSGLASSFFFRSGPLLWCYWVWKVGRGNLRKAISMQRSKGGQYRMWWSLSSSSQRCQPVEPWQWHVPALS
jgi:hypothetical protein